MGNEDKGQNTLEKWKEAVRSILRGSGTNTTNTLSVKQLRHQVLLSVQADPDDRIAKRAFKGAVQELEQERVVKLSQDGTIKLKKQKKRKKEETERRGPHKQWKRRSVEPAVSMEDNQAAATEPQSNDGTDQKVAVSPQNAPTTTNNPQGVTRLFLGNLPFAVDEPTLEDFLFHAVTHIKWITDKETGKFYGSAFVEMKDAASAGQAVSERSGKTLLKRPITINFAPARPGDKWPPEKRVVSGNTSTTTKKQQAGGSGLQAMSARPDNCTKLFCGNLSYDIDDEALTKFFAAVNAEVKAVRWIHHKESGDFKGVGFVDFWNTQACEKAATLNGKTLLGRPIRIDWTD